MRGADAPPPPAGVDAQFARPGAGGTGAQYGRFAPTGGEYASNSHHLLTPGVFVEGLRLWEEGQRVTQRGGPLCQGGRFPRRCLRRARRRRRWRRRWAASATATSSSLTWTRE